MMPYENSVQENAGGCLAVLLTRGVLLLHLLVDLLPRDEPPRQAPGLGEPAPGTRAPRGPPSPVHAPKNAHSVSH